MRLSMGRQEKIECIRSLPAALEAALSDMSEQDLDASYRSGGWSVRQIVHHLADVHLNAYVRVKRLLTEAEPVFTPYEQDAWAALPDAQVAPLRTSLDLLRGLQARLSLTFEKADPEAWHRTAIHPDTGSQRLDDLLDVYAWHGLHHLEQICVVAKQRGKISPTPPPA